MYITVSLALDSHRIMQATIAIVCILYEYSAIDFSLNAQLLLLSTLHCTCKVKLFNSVHT